MKARTPVWARWGTRHGEILAGAIAAAAQVVARSVASTPGTHVAVPDPAPLPAHVARPLPAEWGGVGLTPAQRSVLQALADGLTAHEYARQAYISHATVKFHLAGARRRLHAPTTVRAVVRAIERGEITIARRDVAICGTCGGSGVVEIG